MVRAARTHDVRLRQGATEWVLMAQQVLRRRRQTAIAIDVVVAVLHEKMGSLAHSVFAVSDQLVMSGAIGWLVVGGGVDSAANGEELVGFDGTDAGDGEPEPTKGRESKNVDCGAGVLLVISVTGGVRSVDGAGVSWGTVSGRYAAGKGARSASGKMTRAVICSCPLSLTTT